MSAEKLKPEIQPQPRSIEDQRDILADMQARHLDKLVQSDIGDKVARILDRPDNRLGQMMVATTRIRSGDTDVVSLRIAAATYNLNGDSESSSFRYVEVGQQLEGMTMPVGGFTDEEADLVASMAAELRALKDEGILPNLEPNLMNIFNPATAITMYRPEAEGR